MENNENNMQTEDEALKTLEELQPSPDDELIVPGYVPNVEETTGLEIPEEAQERMANLPVMNEEEILESMCELNEAGTYSLSEGFIEYTRITDYLDKVNDEGELITEVTPDDIEEVVEKDFTNYKLRLYTSDGEHMVVEIEFYTSDDPYLWDVLDVINLYNDDLSNYLEGKTKDFPGIAVSFMPHKAMGHYVVKMHSPIATIRSVNDEGEPSVLTLIFHVGDIDINTYEYTLAEYNQMKDNAFRKEINKLDPEIQQQVSLGTFGAAMPIKVN